MLGETPRRLKQHPFTTLLYILRAELLNIPYAVLEGVGVSWRKAAENESIRKKIVSTMCAVFYLLRNEVLLLRSLRAVEMSALVPKEWTDHHHSMMEPLYQEIHLLWHTCTYVVVYNKVTCTL